MLARPEHPCQNAERCCFQRTRGKAVACCSFFSSSGGRAVICYFLISQAFFIGRKNESAINALLKMAQLDVVRTCLLMSNCYFDNYASTCRVMN